MSCIIKGRIINVDKSLCVGAGIEIIKIDEKGNQSIVGYTYTDENGEYGFTVEKDNSNYKLNIYNSLNKNKL